MRARPAAARRGGSPSAAASCRSSQADGAFGGQCALHRRAVDDASVGAAQVRIVGPEQEEPHDPRALDARRPFEQLDRWHDEVEGAAASGLDAQLDASLGARWGTPSAGRST